MNNLEAPKGLELMPDEKLLAQHGNYYASNKRLIKYSSRLMNTKTDDLFYNHISTISEEITRPLESLLIIGIIIGTAGFFSDFLVVIGGIILVIIGFSYKLVFIKIKSAGDESWHIENANSQSGKQFTKIIRDYANDHHTVNSLKSKCQTLTIKTLQEPNFKQ